MAGYRLLVQIDFTSNAYEKIHTHTVTYTHSHTHTQSHIQSHTHTHTHSHAHSHTHTVTHTVTNTVTHTQAHTQAHTHTYTHRAAPANSAYIESAIDPYFSLIGRNVNGWCPGTHRNDAINVSFLANNISHEKVSSQNFVWVAFRNLKECPLLSYHGCVLTPNGCLAKSLTACQQTFGFPSNLPVRRLVMSMHLICTTM